MNPLINRVIKVMALLYHHEAEIVVSNWGCSLFLGTEKRDISLEYDEVTCLIDNEIVRLDSGFAEEGNERFNYVLTEDSQERIERILKNNKMLRLK